FNAAVPGPRFADRSPRLAVGTPVTVIPECPALAFDPGSLTARWTGRWVRFAFRFTPLYGAPDLAVSISVRVAGIEIANVSCPLTVAAPADPAPSPGDNPLAAAKLRQRSAASYQKIFVSYSRKDAAVVEGYRLAQEALGNEVFVDSYSIRA